MIFNENTDILLNYCISAGSQG